jgi:transposase
MRKSFNGLSAIVTHTLDCDPLSGHLFLFANKRRNLLKLLYWDSDGFAIWYKRLENGTFAMNMFETNTSGQVELTQAQLAMFLGGIDLVQTKKRKRFQLSQKDSDKISS